MNIMERQPTWVLLGEINSTVTRWFIMDSIMANISSNRKMLMRKT
jgi:hypothetical protein